MLKQRVITALCLAAVLFLILWSRSEWLFGLFLLVFFAAGAWENARLFDNTYPIAVAVLASLIFVFTGLWLSSTAYIWFAFVAVLIWVALLIPSLFRTIPPLHTFSGHIYQACYLFSILASFLCVLFLYNRSALFLLSILVIAWLADIGAYFAGRAFGRHKLAPAISPGKTWEGVVGGMVTVILVAIASMSFSTPESNISVLIFEKYGWSGMIGGLVLLVAMSIVGDLLESKLKRRIGFKDSSNLLPGHGGVLDRIDSLIPMLPLAVLLGMWL